jgi:hypothetical protein
MIAMQKRCRIKRAKAKSSNKIINKQANMYVHDMDSTTITIIGASAATVSAVASIINLINSKIEFRKMREKLQKD